MSNIQPRYIIAVTLVVAALMFVSALVELRQSRRELLHVLEEHSLFLAEIIDRSSANIVLSTDQIEQQLSERLLNNAYYIARLDSLNILSRQDLRRFAGANNIYRINIFNAKGEKILASHDLLPHAAQLKEKMSPKEMLKPILRDGEPVLIIGLKQARFEEGQRYAVAIRRTKPAGGAIVLNLDATELVEFRKRIGIGKLVKDLADNTGLDYVAIQDREGVLAATSNVNELTGIDQDALLTLALEHDSVVTRQIEFNGRETFEVVKRLSIEGTTVGLLRIGLSMDELRSTEDRMTRRMLIMSIVLIAIGALVFTAIIVNQNYRIVSQKYAEIKSFTGNILENMGDAVITVDSDDRITIFNRQSEDLFSIEAKQISGKRINELSATNVKCLSTIFSTREPELTLECSPGRMHVVSVSLSRTTKADGSVESRTAVIKDLTETRRLERDVQRKEKLTAMGELASGVAHEIRNPLNAISMIAQRYEREFVPRSGGKEYRSLTKVLKKESARVNDIVQQFLRFSRPPKIKPTSVIASEFVADIATLFEGQAKSKGVNFASRCELSGTISIDPAQMTQALLNLLQNALDATGKGGDISLRVAKKGNDAIFEVADTGSGIPSDKLDRIFDLYFTTKTNGNGMGLAITQQIVSQHQGSIQVVSKLSKGSTFLITLPN